MAPGLPSPKAVTRSGARRGSHGKELRSREVCWAPKAEVPASAAPAPTRKARRPDMRALSDSLDFTMKLHCSPSHPRVTLTLRLLKPDVPHFNTDSVGDAPV